MNCRALALAVLFSIMAGNVMSDPAAQKEGAGQAGSQSSDSNSKTEQSEFTPSQLIAQDFRAMAQDHATVGAANSAKQDAH